VNHTRATERTPDGRVGNRRLFYRSPSAAVTEQWFVTPERAFVVAELHQVRTARIGTNWRLRPRAFEIWAEYDGVVVRIYHSTDEKTFGHVCRALIRARERGVADDEERADHAWAAA